MKGPIAHPGSKLWIEYAVCVNGTCPAKEFFDSLDAPERRKMMALFRQMGDEGKIWNRRRFKKVEGTDFFEFKESQIRILCRFLPGGLLVLVHGFRKKGERIRPSEIEKAERILTEHLGR
jgi:hypothetical protein